MSSRRFKYPGIFQRAWLMLLSKTDLLPNVDFDSPLALENAWRIHPEIGEEFPEWLNWLRGLQVQVETQVAAIP